MQEQVNLRKLQFPIPAFLFKWFESETATMSSQTEAFVKTLTKSEKSYLWDHVFRYAGVEGSTAKEQFAKLVEYVLNFLDGESKMETSIFGKAMKMF